MGITLVVRVPELLSGHTGHTSGVTGVTGMTAGEKKRFLIWNLQILFRAYHKIYEAIPCTRARVTVPFSLLTSRGGEQFWLVGTVGAFTFWDCGISTRRNLW